MIRTKRDPSEDQTITIIGTVESLEAEKDAFLDALFLTEPHLTVQEVGERLYNWIKDRGITVQCTLPRREDQ